MISPPLPPPLLKPLAGLPQAGSCPLICRGLVLHSPSRCFDFMMFFPSLSLSLFFLFGVSLTAALPLASKDSDISDADPVPIGDHLPMVRETFEPEDLVGRDNYRDSSGKYTPLNPRRSRAWSTSSWMKERNSAHVPLRRQEGLPNPNAQPAEVAVGGFTLIKKYQGREFLE